MTAPRTSTTPAEATERLREALALRDELMTYAAQLIRAETQAGFSGTDTAVRVREPAHLAHLLTRAGSAIGARHLAACEAELAAERARGDEAREIAADRDRLAARVAVLEVALDRSWRKVLGYPFPQVCKHLIASNMLGDMEELGFELPREVADAVVRAHDEIALAAAPLRIRRALAITDGGSDGR